jgi:hypothetical protein
LLESIGVAFTAVGFTLILHSIFRIKIHPAYALHAIIFWGFVVAFNTLSTWITDASYDISIYILVHILLFIYLLVFLSLAHHLSSERDTSKFFETIDKISAQTLILGMVPWLSFRMYLLLKYGVASFQLLAFREEVNASYFESSANALLLYLALGSYFIFVVKCGLNLKNALNPLTTIPSIAVFVFVCVFGELLSSRRFLLTAAILFALALLYRRKQILLNFRTVLLIGLIAIATLGMAEFYQQIRFNFFNAEFISLMNQGDLGGISSAVTHYFTAQPDVQHTSIDVETSATLGNFHERFSPFQVIYAIADRQITGFITSKGELLKQSFHNVIPSIFLNDKETVNADHILAETFGLPDDDLPSGILPCIQSEIGWVAFFVAPAFLFSIMSIYKYIFLKSREATLRVVCLGLTIVTATYVESLIDAVLVNMRDLCLLVLILFPITTILRIARRNLLFSRVH